MAHQNINTLLFLACKRCRNYLADTILEELSRDGILFQCLRDVVTNDGLVDFWRNF